jgi:hypothetical protein
MNLRRKEIVMNKQKLPLALDLADAADEVSLWATAAELRRLYEANQVMLEALRECLDCEFSVGEKSVIAKARAAIAKGEQQ